MIIGIGTDIIEIERVKRVVERRSSFMHRFFAPEELDYYRGRRMSAPSIAGGFAAKEAVVKAMGTGFSGFPWKDILILRDKHGKPWVKIEGAARGACTELGIIRIFVSISHSKEYATAQAIAVGGDEYEGCNAETHEGHR